MITQARRAFSADDQLAFAELYDAWSARTLPLLGRWVGGDAEAYRYLHESIRRFPRQEALAEMTAQAGLGNVAWRNLAGGVVALHSAWRI